MRSNVATAVRLLIHPMLAHAATASALLRAKSERVEKGAAQPWRSTAGRSMVVD